MPHFVIDCSERILSSHDEVAICEQVHQVAFSTGLFSEANIQVRVVPFKYNLVGNEQKDFVHVFASILQGRTSEQKSDLCQAVVKKLVEMFPQVTTVGMDVLDLERGTGFNKGML